ncbi:MAG: nicotinate (nicotinamide) nucleotide adenylyltransferase [Bacteroidota bacterium]
MSNSGVFRIGIYGGTFNPPHMAHLIVAENVCERFRLDKLFFIPSYISPHKKRGEDKLALHRLRMVRSAIKGNPRFDISDLELKRKGISYTYETVEAFHREFPHSKLFLLIGADNFAEFHTWKHPERVVELASVIVMNRQFQKSGAVDKNFSRTVRFALVPDIQISSSEIRTMVHQHKSIRYLVPHVVFRYIERQKLYR